MREPSGMTYISQRRSVAPPDGGPASGLRNALETVGGIGPVQRGSRESADRQANRSVYEQVHRVLLVCERAAAFRSLLGRFVSGAVLRVEDDTGALAPSRGDKQSRAWPDHVRRERSGLELDGVEGCSEEYAYASLKRIAGRLLAGNPVERTLHPHRSGA